MTLGIVFCPWLGAWCLAPDDDDDDDALSVLLATRDSKSVFLSSLSSSSSSSSSSPLRLLVDQMAIAFIMAMTSNDCWLQCQCYGWVITLIARSKSLLGKG